MVDLGCAGEFNTTILFQAGPLHEQLRPPGLHGAALGRLPLQLLAHLRPVRGAPDRAPECDLLGCI